MVQQHTQDRLDATFSALADPTRRAILARLASGETSVSELAEPFEMTMPAISKHLKVLQRAGLIERGREAQFAAPVNRAVLGAVIGREAGQPPRAIVSAANQSDCR